MCLCVVNAEKKGKWSKGKEMSVSVLWRLSKRGCMGEENRLCVV